MVNVECVYNEICHLGEGPVWNIQQQKLYWTDIFNRRIWVYDPASNQSSIFWKGELQVGGFAFTRNGGIVLCTDKGVYMLEAGADNPVLLFDIPLSKGEMFNDITIDPHGRIFAGTVKRPGFKDGTLYRIEKGKQPVVVLGNLLCSNGMTFSMDEKYFFHTDSFHSTITKYDYDLMTGEICNPVIYFKAEIDTGLPDGITADSEGYIWAAFWGGSCIRKIDPEGRIAAEIPIPAKQPSSVMFGGKNMDELYITSASDHADDIVTGYCSDGVFIGGPVYRCHPGVIGRAEWLADF